MRRFLKGLFTMIAEIIIGGLWAFGMIVGVVLIWLCLYGIIRAFTM